MRRVALLECEDAEKWEGYTELLWKEALQQEGDEWVVFRACKGELPSPKAAAAFDAVIVGGSHYSAYEQHEWIEKLLEFLPLVVAQQHTRIYGCCFGCQILARALGGEVGKNPNGNFTLTIEHVWTTGELQQYQQLNAVVQQALATISSPTNNPSPAVTATSTTSQDQADCQPTGKATQASTSSAACTAGAVLETPQTTQAGMSSSSSSSSRQGRQGSSDAQPAAAGAKCHGCFKLIESHGDQVLQLPLGAVQLASSATAVHELWCFGPNVLASQFHLELTAPLVLQKILGALKDKGVLTEQQAEDSRRVLEAGDSNTALFLQVVQHFLNHGLVERNTTHHHHQQQQHRDLPTHMSPAVPPVFTSVAPLSSAAAAAALAAAQGTGVSGCSSPSAASERSVATTTATSTTSIAPFSHIEHQRKQQARDQGLQDSSERMVHDAAAAFDLKMESYHMDFVALQQLNGAAAEQYSSTAEIATALGNFVADLGSRQAGVRDALAALPLLDRQLKQLEVTVGKLDKQSKDLEARVAKLQLDKSSKGEGVGFSAYNYLSASFNSIAAAGAGQCLGGVNLPKE